MPRAKNQTVEEWLHIGNSILKVYANFFYWILKPRFPLRECGKQFIRTMLEGFTTVMVGSVVMGMFLAWLGGWYGSLYGAVSWIGPIATIGTIQEFTIMIAGMLYACRVGTAFTVEIGSMRMSGQIDALRLMAVEPIQHIVIPRVMASVVTLPILLGIAHGVAIISTVLLLNWWFDISVHITLENAFVYLKSPYLTHSFIRIGIMGFFIALNACAQGYYFTGGAEELGKTTTKSIVVNFIYVLVIHLLTGVILTVTGLGFGEL